MTTNDGECHRSPLRWSARNSARRRSRACFGNAAGAARSIELTRLFGWNLDGEALAPLRPPTIDHVSATG
jgi:hypothetical protein